MESFGNRRNALRLLVVWLSSENGLQRGNCACAALDSVAAIAKLLTYNILRYSNPSDLGKILPRLAKIFTTQRSLDVARGQILGGNGIATCGAAERSRASRLVAQHHAPPTHARTARDLGREAGRSETRIEPLQKVGVSPDTPAIKVHSRKELAELANVSRSWKD